MAGRTVTKDDLTELMENVRIEMDLHSDVLDARITGVRNWMLALVGANVLAAVGTTAAAFTAGHGITRSVLGALGLQ